MEHRHWQDWVTGLVGLWLIASPFVLDFSLGEGTSTTLLMANFLVCGGLALILAASALAAFRNWEEWIAVALGVWLAASPWLLAFSTAQTAAWNTVICGVIIAALATWTLYDESSAGHA
nr:SPW repeat protein [Tranquillimonas alkanivorans]